MTAFVLGNGISREQISIDVLLSCGSVYACNGVYRTHQVTALIATDTPISQEIQESKYSLNNRFYTRRPIPGLGALPVPKEYFGFSSGPIATAIAAEDRQPVIYLLGFDMAGINDRFNNVYADSEFYKRSGATPTYTGNWERQLLKVMHDYPHTNFIRVHGAVTSDVPEFAKHPRYSRLNIGDFQTLFGV